MVVLGSSIGNWGGYHNFSWSWGWVDRVSSPFNNSIETIVGISGVVDSPGGTVSFSQGVRSFDYITFTDFVLALVITSVGVLDTVVVFVSGWGIVILGFEGVGDGGGVDNGSTKNGGGVGKGAGVSQGSSVGGYQGGGDRGV